MKFTLEGRRRTVCYVSNATGFAYKQAMEAISKRCRAYSFNRSKAA